jgi:3-dehydroquinate synthase
MIGAFHQPAAVLIDTDCLSTLPARELGAGLRRCVKHGAIRDATFFEWLEHAAARLVARERAGARARDLESCRIKAAVVAADERETGERALLNFGHTFGHASRDRHTATDVAARRGGGCRHGDRGAVSERVLAFPRDDTERLCTLLRQLGVPLDPPVLPLSLCSS